MAAQPIGPGSVPLDSDRIKLTNLAFKKATTGLTPAEEKEMADLQQKIALANAAAGNGS